MNTLTRSIKHIQTATLQNPESTILLEGIVLSLSNLISLTNNQKYKLKTLFTYFT